MRTFLIVSIFSLFGTFSSAQIFKPINWSFEVNQNKDDTYTFTATAKIDENWVVYSQHTGEGGPIPLEFTYDDGIAKIGETEEISPAIKKMSKLFEMEVIQFKNEAVFTQKFIPNKGQSSIKGYLTFMCCDSNKCLPPTDVDFDVAF
ncbi:MAG: protein-disulfide reductase DsbD domain-containing protein [Bacteroidota bacterium]